MGESIIGHVPSVENPADMCTKFVPCGKKRNHLILMIFIEQDLILKEDKGAYNHV
jgi:hypothetical protein